MVRAAGGDVIAISGGDSVLKTLLNHLGLFFTLVTLIAVALAATALTDLNAWEMTIVAGAAQIMAIVLFLSNSTE